MRTSLMERAAECVRQGRDREAKPVGLLPGLRPGGAGRAGGRRLAKAPVVLARPRPACLSAEPVAGAVDQHPVQPRCRATAAIKLLPSCQGLLERLLRHVRRVLLPAGHAKRRAKQPRVPGSDLFVTWKFHDALDCPE